MQRIISASVTAGFTVSAPLVVSVGPFPRGSVLRSLSYHLSSFDASAAQIAGLGLFLHAAKPVPTLAGLSVGRSMIAGPFVPGSSFPSLEMVIAVNNYVVGVDTFALSSFDTIGRLPLSVRLEEFNWLVFGLATNGGGYAANLSVDAVDARGVEFSS